MPLTSERLQDMVRELVSRPGHPKVSALVYELLIHGLDARSTEVLFEQSVPEVHGRADALLGRTIFEFKSDLRTELGDAESQLTRYLGDRERATRNHFVGIATDGAAFIPYELRNGQLSPLSAPFRPTVAAPRALLDWLGGAVALQPELPPDPETVRRELGRGSLAFAVARSRLAELWADVKDTPAVRLKRQLWADLLARVYGSGVDDDNLFFQHTYLTIVAKTMATRVLSIALPEPEALLSGQHFQNTGITGAVESDFFDWVLAADGSHDVIRRLARQVERFRLQDVRQDVLKTLYESLIDPEQRHDLGEYYTPDWLAAKVCARAITHPLEQRVLDPACGSGTFLFHAVRRFLAAADAAGLTNREALNRCCDQVLGIDVHPVAVLIARVTFLLALGEERLRDRPNLNIPVYLGDSLQWNTRRFLAEREVLIEVPGGRVLYFPAVVTADPTRFDAVLRRMLELSEQNTPGAALRSWLDQQGIGDDRDIGVLVETYEQLRQLHQDELDHIWAYVTRNLSRPIWLSSAGQRVDVVVGNPPWLSYRFMSTEMQQRFREECQQRGLWAGGRVATHQDLSAYFFARCVELYLRPEGTIAFVMPYAALSRRQFQGFRSGWYEARGTLGSTVYASIRFTEAWAFDEHVQPLFPVPSCVLFAEPDGRSPLPGTVLAYSGMLPRRDAAPDEADAVLGRREVPWPQEAEFVGGSPYREAFRQGATMVPRKLCVVETATVGWLGMNRDAPLVESRRKRQEKPPWRDLPALRGPIETQFLRLLYLGESIAPFRLLSPVLAVIPWDSRIGQLLDAAGALRSAYVSLSRWLRQAESLWQEHGRGAMTLLERWDYHGGLRTQFPPAPLRVLYAASGTLPAAALIQDSRAVAEHKLYWTPIADLAEGRYLEAILNSETTRRRVEHLQSRGQWGARDFDKVMFELPIPRFDRRQRLHRDLAAAAEHAEAIAASVQLPEAVHFVRARRIVRQALQEDGVAQRIDALVVQLLGG